MTGDREAIWMLLNRSEPEAKRLARRMLHEQTTTTLNVWSEQARLFWSLMTEELNERQREEAERGQRRHS